MASKKRKPSKSMRQQRNRVQRQRAEARSDHAGEATAIARGEAEPVSAPRPPTSTSAGAAAPGDPKVTARQQRMTKRQQILAERYPIPGQRWVMMAFLFSVVTAGLLIITPLQYEDEVPIGDPRVVDAIDVNDDGLAELVVVEGEEETTILVEPDDPRVIADQLAEGEAEGTVLVPRDSRLFSEFDLGVALALVLIPIVITGIAFAATKHEKRSTIWTMCLVAYAGYIFLFASGIGILALPAMIALMVGNYQSRKAVTMERLAQQKLAKAAAGGEVIDVESDEVAPDD